MIPKYLLILIAIFTVPIVAFAQNNPCDNPYPDDCQFPDTCCAVPRSNCPWQITGVDVTYLVNFFKGGPTYDGPYGKFDVNCDCRVSGADIIYLVNYFKGRGPELKCCFYQCQIHYPIATLGDLVWYDSNNNGIQDTRETGISGVDVQLTDCNDPPNLLRWETTDSSGYFQFDSLLAGCYKIHYDLPDSFQFTLQDQGISNFRDSDADPATGFTDTIHAYQDMADLTWDAGMYNPAWYGTIGDRAWYDYNTNGIQDSGEVGLEGIWVELYACLDSNEYITRDTTDSNGNYIFNTIPYGEYYLRILLPDEYIISEPDQGTDDLLDSDFDPQTRTSICFNLERGELALSWDLGLYWPYMEGEIGDYVWNDIDMDGILDTAEAGIPNINIALYLEYDSSLVMNAQTDSSGHYRFLRIPAGFYYLQAELVEGYAFSPKDQGDNDSLDSDINPETGLSDQFFLVTDDTDISRDIGMYMSIDSGCTYTICYWKNHAGHDGQPDLVTPLLPIWLGLPDSSESIMVDSASTAYDVFRLHTYGNPLNGITVLYAQLLAAKLNIASGANGDAVDDIIPAIDEFLATHDWHNWFWLDFEQKRIVLQWIMILDAYNLGTIGPGACPDTMIE